MYATATQARSAPSARGRQTHGSHGTRDLDTPTLRTTGNPPPGFLGGNRALSGGPIQAVGAPRLATRCACGGSCPHCRNPNDESGGSTPMTRGASAGAKTGLTTRDEAPTVDGAVGGTNAAGADALAGGAAGAGAGAGAAPAARSAKLRSGPRYTPHGALAPNLAGGVKNVPFDFDAVFESDPANNVFPGCGEIHQDIKWDAAAAANGNAQWGLSVPHAGFPATHPANRWIEDRDGADTRYGRRAGAQSAPGPGDQYTDGTGAQNETRGATYHGHDNPSNLPDAFHGRWSFMVLAFDMCNQGTQIGNADFITIDW